MVKVVELHTKNTNLFVFCQMLCVERDGSEVKAKSWVMSLAKREDFDTNMPCLQ